MKDPKAFQHPGMNQPAQLKIKEPLKRARW